MSNRKFVDLTTIPEKDLPLFVFVDDRQALFSFGIKNHTKGNYNHAMIMYRPGYFASQDTAGYREVPIRKYMKVSMMLKLWKYKDITNKEKILLLNSIQAKLNVPWWKRRYDFLGLIGQMFRIPKLNNPWADYCSEDVRNHCAETLGFTHLPLHPSPSGLNNEFKKMNSMEIYGYWWMD